MKKSIILLVWLCSTLAHAQPNDWQQRYLNAKEFYNNGKYALAMESFKPLIEEAPGNHFYTYSSFYYALAAYNSDYKPMAKSMLLQLKSRYPNWSKLDEVNYWLAHINFEQENYNQALSLLKEIKADELKDELVAMKYNYLSPIKDQETLKALFENNSEDEVLGYLMAKAIAAQPLVNQDQKMLGSLIDKFDLNPAEFNAIEVEKSVFKENYKVAVLLPFMADDLQPNLRRKVNQFVLDLYQGIELAADTLKKQGVGVQVHAYDTKRSEKVTAQLLEKEEMKGMDLIIGPLYAKPIELVNDFSYKNKINVINPLSSNAEVIGNNPFSFLFFPSNETIGRRSAEYVVKHVESKPGIIFYEDNPNDSAMAFAYKQRIEMDSFKIIHTKKIKRDSSRAILDMLLIASAKIKDAATEEAKEDYTIKLDSVGHIFVASTNDLISSKVLSAVETRGDSITVIGSSDWLNLAVIKFDTYFSLGAVLYAPNYNMSTTEEYKAFRTQYITRHKQIPGKYSEIGYELMYTMGESLKEHGKYFQLAWKRSGDLPGHLTAGFNYSNANDNLIVPMLQFDEGEIKIVVNE